MVLLSGDEWGLIFQKLFSFDQPGHYLNALVAISQCEPKLKASEMLVYCFDKAQHAQLARIFSSSIIRVMARIVPVAHIYPFGSLQWVTHDGRGYVHRYGPGAERELLITEKLAPIPGTNVLAPTRSDQGGYITKACPVTIADYVENVGMLDLIQASELLTCLSGAMSIAHENGIVHNNLTPGNVLVSQDGRLYISGWERASDHATEPLARRLDVRLLGALLESICSPEVRNDPVFRPIVDACMEVGEWVQKKSMGDLVYVNLKVSSDRCKSGELCPADVWSPNAFRTARIDAADTCMPINEIAIKCLLAGHTRPCGDGFVSTIQWQ